MIKNKVKASNKNIKDKKKEVYKITGLKTTKEIKKQNKKFYQLDLRYKKSWEIILNSLKEKSSNSLEEWCANPPEKYRQVLSDMEELSRETKSCLSDVKKAFNRLGGEISELEELSKTTENESKNISEENIISIPIMKPGKNK